MKIYGHPWSTNTRKTLMTLAEKGHEAELVVIALPKGEHTQPEHLARHPFGRVPVLDDDGFVLYEARAINAYLDRKLGGPKLSPASAREAAWVDQWTNVADAYSGSVAELNAHALGLVALDPDDLRVEREAPGNVTRSTHAVRSAAAEAPATNARPLRRLCW